MEIFISWSGDRSKLIAERLHDWLPEVLQLTKPWCSSKDINCGDFWDDSVRNKLKESQFAILCLTKENIGSPWVNYEAGTIAEKLNGKVCPYLFQMSPSDLGKSPLSRLQAVTADKEGTLKLLKTLNILIMQQGMKSLEDALLKKSFNRCWGELDHFFRGPNVLEGGEKNLDALVRANSLKDILLIAKEVFEEFSKNTSGDQQYLLKGKIAQLSAHLEKLDSITPNFSIWAEAENWLRKNQKRLVPIAIEGCLKKYSELTNPGRNLDLPEKVTKFEENINNYILWILTLLEKQTDEIHLDELPIIPEKMLYKDVFLHIIEAVRNSRESPSEAAKNAIVGRLNLLIEKKFSS
jgi:hypothetical protein